MLALDDRFPMSEVKVISLPDDLMVTPISSIFGLQICHSDTTGKWYALRNYSEPIDTQEGEVFSGLVFSGSWASLADSCFDACSAFAPFKWGIPYPCKYSPKAVQYIPIWEDIETGRYNDEGLPIMREDYKLITLMPCTLDDSNSIQYNFDSRFHIEDYGVDLIRLVRDLEIFTGKIF